MLDPKYLIGICLIASCFLAAPARAEDSPVIPIPPQFLGRWNAVPLQFYNIDIRPDGHINEYDPRNGKLDSHEEYKVIGFKNGTLSLIVAEYPPPETVKSGHALNRILYQYELLVIDPGCADFSTGDLRIYKIGNLLEKKDWDIPVSSHSTELRKITCDCSTFCYGHSWTDYAGAISYVRPKQNGER